MRIKQIDGKPVFDAKRPMKLHVTKKDASDADRKEPSSCAVALGLMREHDSIKEVRVHLGRVYVRTNETNWQRYMTPLSLRQEIIAFDRGGKFLEGEFVLPAPQPSKRASGKRQGSSKRGKSGVKRRPYRILTDVRGGPA